MLNIEEIINNENQKRMQYCIALRHCETESSNTKIMYSKRLSYKERRENA